jgi:hypothetical protein
MVEAAWKTALGQSTQDLQITSFKAALSQSWSVFFIPVSSLSSIAQRTQEGAEKPKLMGRGIENSLKCFSHSSVNYSPAKIFWK